MKNAIWITVSALGFTVVVIIVALVVGSTSVDFSPGEEQEETSACQFYADEAASGAVAGADDGAE